MGNGREGGRFHVEEKRGMERGLHQSTIAALGHPSFGHCSASPMQCFWGPIIPAKRAWLVLSGPPWHTPIVSGSVPWGP